MFNKYELHDLYESGRKVQGQWSVKPWRPEKNIYDSLWDQHNRWEISYG